MKTKIAFFLSAFIIMAFFAQAQQDHKIKFEKTTHEFGKIEFNGPAEYTFKFTNVSEEPVTLDRVKASCGCTTPSWTKEEIAPGAEGEIKVKYNTNRPGIFTKTVTVTYDTEEKPVVLYIKGEVEKNPEAADLTAFRYNMKGLTFDQINQTIGTLDSDKTKTIVFKVKNVSPQPISFTGVYDKEMMFEIEQDKMQLTPGQIGTIKVSILGERFITPGPFSKKITLYTDDQEQPGKVLSINGNINKVYTESELAAMPGIEFELTEYDAGNILEGEKVIYGYKFKNTGKGDLEIESVKASCGCTATAPRDKVIPGGGTSEIIANFDSRGRQGQQTKTITVRTNDPQNPTIVLRLKANVEKDPFHVGGGVLPGNNNN
ncbi:MAG: DUF1573 domain-containing protein [Bacteroidetes bacterium]|nr:DUF1573 domain-containing protein [Bacteroidota bacterium]MCB0843480.1 DUF1573 domain-containing protein [Bacteroidota bacterium]MCB0854204.1 DUF1573 domain-containing protein [Bacteroidota bacterium]